MDLSGRIAFITGANRGIGQAIAIEMARRGAIIAISYATHKEEAEETAHQIKALSHEEPMVFQLDVSDAKQVDEVVLRIQERHQTIDILVNNAGVSKDSLLIRTSDENWQQTLSVNLSGAFYCSRACTKWMMKKRYGRLIQITSLVGQCGNGGQSAYSASKAGMVGLTLSMAKELGSRGITSNAIAPGWIETQMTEQYTHEQKDQITKSIPAGFIGLPLDVAHLAVFLASPQARYINGQVIGINGGLYT